MSTGKTIDHTDLTFFTNEEGHSLLSRFKSTLKDSQQFDVLVGYFRASGFINCMTLWNLFLNQDTCRAQY